MNVPLLNDRPCAICSGPSTVTIVVRVKARIIVPGGGKVERAAFFCDRCAGAYLAAFDRIIARGGAAQAAAAQEDSKALEAQKGHVDA